MGDESDADRADESIDEVPLPDEVPSDEPEVTDIPVIPSEEEEAGTTPEGTEGSLDPVDQPDNTEVDTPDIPAEPAPSEQEETSEALRSEEDGSGLESMQAQSENCGDNLTWTLSDTGVLTISGTGAMFDYAPPSLVPWFENENDIRTLVVENGVTYIGKYAFESCSKISSVSFPASLTGIGDYAFAYCSGLRSLTLPSSLTSIGMNAFWDCYLLRNVTFPENLKSIGDFAFFSCALRSVTLPASLTSLGNGVFGDCSELASFSLNNGSTCFKVNDGVLFSIDGKTLVAYPEDKGSEYEVPSGTSSIPAYALWMRIFRFCNQTASTYTD